MMKNEKRNRLRKSVAVVLTVAPLVWIFSQVSITQLQETMQNIAWWVFAVIIISSSLAFLLQALRWAFLLRAFDSGLEFRRIIDIHFRSVYYSMVLPTSAAQDIVRTFLISRQTHYSISWGAAWICRLIGLVILLLLSLYGFYAISSSSSVFSSIVPVFILAVFLVGIGVVLSFSKSLTTPARLVMQKWIPAKFFDTILNVRDGIYKFRHKKGAVLISALIALCLYSLVVITPSMILKGITGRYYFFECLAFIPLIEVITMVAPLTPNGVGIREGLNALMLGYIGLTEEQIGLYVTFLIFSAFLKIIGGIPVLYRYIRKKQQKLQQITG